jgi:hypothetical protein
MEIVASQTIYPLFEWYWVAVVVGAIFLGVQILGFEIFILPRFGAAGLVGVILLLGGIVFSWIVLGPTWGALVSVAACAFSTATFLLVTKTGFVRRRIARSQDEAAGGAGLGSGHGGEGA